MTLVCEDTNSELVDVVTAAEERLDDSLGDIFKLVFGPSYEIEIWSRFQS